MGAQVSPVRLEVYVQALSPEKNHRIDALLDRIKELEASDVVSSSKVYVVGTDICPKIAMETKTGQHLCGRILQFRDWARRTNRTLEPFFQPQTVTSRLSDDEYEVVPIPTLTLAEFVDDTLQFVTPCSDDDDTHVTPMDRLEALTEMLQPDESNSPSLGT